MSCPTSDLYPGHPKPERKRGETFPSHLHAASQRKLCVATHWWGRSAAEPFPPGSFVKRQRKQALSLCNHEQKRWYTSFARFICSVTNIKVKMAESVTFLRENRDQTILGLKTCRHNFINGPPWWILIFLFVVVEVICFIKKIYIL